MRSANTMIMIDDQQVLVSIFAFSTALHMVYHSIGIMFNISAHPGYQILTFYAI